LISLFSIQCGLDKKVIAAFGAGTIISDAFALLLIEIKVANRFVERFSEVVARLYTRQLNEKRRLSDLIQIGGSKDQAGVGAVMLRALEAPPMPLPGLAVRQGH